MMLHPSFRKFRFFFCFITVCLVAFSAGCLFQGPRPSEEKPYRPNVDKMVVIGFQSALTQWDEPDMVRSPLSGAVFMAEPVSQSVTDKMTTRLFDRILKNQTFEIISPAQARGVFLNLVESDLVMGEVEILQGVGKAFSADGVLIGYIYRWREREGGDFAVNRAASAAFELYLLRPGDGRILWKGRFDKTQKSLSENILDMGTFLKGRGRWMTVEKLGEMGLDEILKGLSGIGGAPEE